jgi:hypothetical protein
MECRETGETVKENQEGTLLQITEINIALTSKPIYFSIDPGGIFNEETYLESNNRSDNDAVPDYPWTGGVWSD